MEKGQEKQLIEEKKNDEVVVTDESIHNLDQEALSGIDLEAEDPTIPVKGETSDKGTITPEKESDDKTPEEGTIESEEKAKKEPEGEISKEETIKPEGEETKPKEGEEIDPRDKALKDTQRAFHEKAKENKRLLRELSDVNRRLLEKEKPVDLAEYTPEQLEELKELDPDRYADIMVAKRQFDIDEKTYQDRIDASDKETERQGKIVAQQTTIKNIVDAVGDLTGIKGTAGAEFEDQPKEFKEFVMSDRFKETINYIDDHSKQYYEEDGSMSRKTIRMVYNDFNPEGVKSQAKAEGRQEAIDSISNPNNGASKLGKAGKSDIETGRKSFDDLTQQDIEDLPPKELKSYLKDAESQGLIES